MRYFLLIAMLCIATLNSLGQDLPLDEYGKVDFQEIVKMNGYERQQLLANARAWINETYDYNKKSIRFDSNTASATGRFLVYVKGAFSQQIHGAIRYKVLVNVKDGKYLYQFTDFVFEYYAINRVYKYVPNGKERPLEEPHFPGWEAPWQKDKQITYDRITKEIDGLKGAMFVKYAPQASKEKEIEKKPSLKEEFDK